MTADPMMDKLVATIEDALKAANKTEKLSEPITKASHMGNPKEWDSLSFVAVFTAVGGAFDVELEDDDAIHFQRVDSIHALLLDIL